MRALALRRLSNRAKSVASAIFMTGNRGKITGQECVGVLAVASLGLWLMFFGSVLFQSGRDQEAHNFKLTNYIMSCFDGNRQFIMASLSPLPHTMSTKPPRSDSSIRKS
jgi:hypothetical protein